MAKQTRFKRCWRIRGYDSSEEIFDQIIPVADMTKNKVKELLRTLAAKYLSRDELIGAYARRDARIYNSLLEIHTDNDTVKKRTQYTCGHNPFFVVSIEA